MADITKCKGTDCPQKETCYRFKAPGNDYYQSYFSEVPFNHEAGWCEQYWHMYKQPEKNKQTGDKNE